jgi:hypothetical protein
LEQAISEHRRLAAPLFHTLFGRLAERLTPGRRLIIVPDGILYYSF